MVPPASLSADPRSFTQVHVHGGVPNTSWFVRSKKQQRELSGLLTRSPWLSYCGSRGFQLLITPTLPLHRQTCKSSFLYSSAQSSPKLCGAYLCLDLAALPLVPQRSGDAELLQVL